MAQTVTQNFSRVVEIDGDLVGFTTEDVRQARAHAQLSGVRGQLSADKIEAWFRDGQPEYEIESNSGPTNGDEVVAKLVFRKIGKNGVLGTKDYEIAIDRDAVRAVRGPKRGRASGADLLNAVKAEITSEMSPIHIETVKGEVHSIDKDGNQLSTRKDEGGTIRLLQNRVAELEAKLAEYAEVDPESEDSTESESESE